MTGLRIRDFGINIGSLPSGPRNKITDVPGVLVGHTTLDNGPVKTGVTAILPHAGNLFQDKVLAASEVINGFGKTMGLIQVNELGCIEVPIMLTNTLSVGVAADAVVRYMLKRNPDIGRTTGTVNPVVGECNDAYLNDIRGCHITQDHVWQAIESASADYSEGAVGAGTGMSCYGLKGGIGSASRLLNTGSGTYTIGLLVLANFGRLEDLTIGSLPAGRMIAELTTENDQQPDRGSAMLIVATDLPLTERQLRRVCRRAVIGLTRTGSYLGHGSGDVVIGFSTANRIEHYPPSELKTIGMLAEERLDVAFRAVGEACEEAILNALVSAHTTTGRDGHRRVSLRQYLPAILDHN